MSEKKTRIKKKKIKSIQSTQYNVPVKEIINGVIITTDNRYVKIIEVIPSPFFLKKISEQNNDYYSFIKMLRSSPRKIQIKCVALPANLSKQIDILEKDREMEDNPECRKIDDEYEKRLLESQYYGISRRFFIIIEYEDSNASLFGKKRRNLDDITNKLNTDAYNIANTLQETGATVITGSRENPNALQAEILYTLLNRKKSNKVSYEKNLTAVTERYFKELNSSNVNIPVLDCIAPSEIQYKVNRVYVDGMWYGYCFLTSDGYPKYGIPGWMNVFVSSDIGVDVDIFLERYDKDEIINKLRRNAARASVDLRESTSISESANNATSTYVANNYLVNGLSSGTEEFYYASILISVCDEDPDYVDQKIADVITRATQYSMRVVELKVGAEDAFNSTLPLNKLNKDLSHKTRRNMLTEGAGTLYPLTTFQIDDTDGAYVGDDRQSGSLVILDPFNTDRFQNANGFIAGTTGSGKTYTLCLLAIRFRIKHCPVFIVAPTKSDEFVRLTSAMGGEYITISEGSRNVINIMEIFMRDETADETMFQINGVKKETSLLMEKISTIRDFFALLYQDLNNSIEEKHLLEEAAIKTYARFGINADNASLYDSTGTKFKKMPILSDLLETMKEMKSEGIHGLDRLITITSMFTAGSASFFNGETNVDLKNSFIVFDLDGCSAEYLPLAIFTVMDFCWSKIKEDKTKKKLLFIDEWWKMAANPVAAAYSYEISKTIRAYGGAFWVATQQMSDVNSIEGGKFGRAVINNSKIKILMGMEDNDLSATRQLVDISDKEAQSISKFKRGEALFIADKTRMEIKFVAGDTEHKLITTDRKDLEKIKLSKQKELDEQKRLEEIKNAKELSNVFLPLDKYNNNVFISTSSLFSPEDLKSHEEDDKDDLSNLFVSIKNTTENKEEQP